MGKQNKQKAKGNESPKLLSTRALEEKTAVDLEQKNYRRAKEWLKELTKRNKEQYQPALIDCYQKLAGQMLEKGLRNEAKTVFDQIRLLTGRSVDGLLEAQSLTMGDDYPAAAAAMVERLGDAPQNPLSAEEERRLADALVVAFGEVPGLQEKHPGLQKELTAVRTALEHLSGGRFSEAQGEIKAIGRSSIFFNWRFFIKGLCAFYSGDDAKAREALLRIDEGSLLFRAARPFIYIIDEGTTPLPKEEAKEPLLMDVCRVLNHPDLEHALPRAEYLWRTGRPADSLEHLLRTVGDFPTLTSGLLRPLSLFYFNIAFQMVPDRQEKYLREIQGAIKRIPGRPVASLLLARIRALLLERNPFLSGDELWDIWEQFLLDHGRVVGKNDGLHALAYAHLGDLLAGEVTKRSEPGYGVRRGRKPQIRNPELAEDAYARSIALAPDNRDVHLKLMKLYEKCGDHAARNKKLDEMTRLFPEDKDVLFQNGVNCIERKAFLKGLDYLRRALFLDPLSRICREALVNGLSSASLHFARQKKIERSRAWMKEALECAEGAHPSDMTMGKPCLLIRMALFEWTSGVKEEGDSLFARALQDGNTEGWLVYFACLLGYAYRLPGNITARLQKDAVAVAANFSPVGVAIATDVLKYMKPLASQAIWLEGERERIRKRALKVADWPCREEDARRIIEDAMEEDWRNRELIKKLVENMLGVDPRSPWFLYYRFVNEKYAGHFRLPNTNDVQELENIKGIALERNDRLLVNALDREIRKIEMKMSSPGGGAYDDGDDFDDGDDDDFIDDDDDDDDDDDPADIDFEQIARELIDEMARRAGPRGKQPSPRRNKKRTGDAQRTLFDDPENPF